MKIDIDRLSEAELIDLSNRIVARLRFLQQMRAHVEMLEFNIGDRVTFQPPGQGSVDWLLCGSGVQRPWHDRCPAALLSGGQQLVGRTEELIPDAVQRNSRSR